MDGFFQKKIEKNNWEMSNFLEDEKSCSCVEVDGYGKQPWSDQVSRGKVTMEIVSKTISITGFISAWYGVADPGQPQEPSFFS